MTSQCLVISVPAYIRTSSRFSSPLKRSQEFTVNIENLYRLDSYRYDFRSVFEKDEG